MNTRTIQRIPAKQIPLGLLIMVQCDCATRIQTYPTYRTRPHLTDCVWDEVQQWCETFLEMTADGKSSRGKSTVNTEPRKPSDPRPNNKPYFINPNCDI